MSNVQVKHIPDDVHEQLRNRAAGHGTTISEYVLELIRRDLARPDRQAWLRRVSTPPVIRLDMSEIDRLREELRRERDGDDR